MITRSTQKSAKKPNQTVGNNPIKHCSYGDIFKEYCSCLDGFKYVGYI